MESIGNITNIFSSLLHSIFSAFGDGIYIVVPFFLIVGIVAMFRMFEKAGQNGWACLVPGYNIVVFMRIVGRPDWHAWLFLIPFVNLYLLVKVHFELIESFGHRSLVDYVMLLIFNIFYILNMGLSYETKYYGPVYGLSGTGVRSAQMA